MASIFRLGRLRGVECIVLVGRQRDERRRKASEALLQSPPRLPFRTRSRARKKCAKYEMEKTRKNAEEDALIAARLVIPFNLR